MTPGIRATGGGGGGASAEEPLRQENGENKRIRRMGNGKNGVVKIVNHENEE